MAGGEALLSPGLTRRLIARLVGRIRSRKVNAETLAQLTEREREVAGLAAYGMSNDEIAVALSISQAAGFVAIESVVEEWADGNDAEWGFNNVHDEDGKPLGWWNPI